MGTRQSPDRVVVVGAGVVGLSTAWFLQERGVEVTVVDRDGVAADASWGNAGWLAPALTLPLPEPAVLQYGLRAMLSPSSPVYVPLTTDLKLIRFLVGFARHCTPSKWQEAMSVYTEVNRTALGAYDELADGGVKELTAPGRSFPSPRLRPRRTDRPWWTSSTTSKLPAEKSTSTSSTTTRFIRSSLHSARV